MWYPATIKTPADGEPVTVEAARRQCGIAATDNSQDLHLTLLIAAGRAHIEKYCGIRLPVQTLTVPCDGFADLARVPEAPIKSVVGIRYVDAAGDEQTVSASVYDERLDGLFPSIVLAHGQVWPAVQPGSRVIVEIEVGYESLPKDLEAALLLLVAAQFTFAGKSLTVRREDVDGVGSTQYGGIVEVNHAVRAAVDALLENYRCWPLA